MRLITCLREESRWPAIQSRAKEYLAPGRLERVSDLLRENEAVTGELIEAPDAPVSLVGYVVRQAILRTAEMRCLGPRGWPVCPGTFF